MRYFVVAFVVCCMMCGVCEAMDLGPRETELVDHVANIDAKINELVVARHRAVGSYQELQRVKQIQERNEAVEAEALKVTEAPAEVVDKK